MSKQIKTEMVYLKSIDGYIRRYEDDYGVFWYVYDELCDVLLVTRQARKNIFNHWLDDIDKAEFQDTIGKRNIFITTNAVSKMINRNNERADKILKDIINTETRGENYNLTELDKELNNLATYLNKQGLRNYVDIVQNIAKIEKMDDYKETRCKYDKNYDREKEELIELFREDVYNYDLNEYDEVNVIMKPKEGYEEEYKVAFKRNKGKKSTCPSWIKDVVK